MTRVNLDELAATDPYYAAASGAGKFEDMDDDQLYIEIGRAVCAIHALERHGWSIVRTEDIAKTTPGDANETQ
jgi:hypothetical protein